jgi:carbonic anhydrase/acetyltransferase-like protein (isoleucine patch superfamily)
MDGYTGSNCFEFDGVIPVVHPESFVHPQATLIGEVIIEARVYVGPGAVLRADWGRILIGQGSNVQENCVLHMFPGLEVVLEEDAHIGHGAIIHGARVGRNSLIGMNAVLMDRVQIGAESIVGALSFVAQDSEFAPRSLIVGNPAKCLREVDDEMLRWKSAGTALYQKLPAAWQTYARPVAALKPSETSRTQTRSGLWDTVNFSPKSR